MGQAISNRIQILDSLADSNRYLINLLNELELLEWVQIFKDVVIEKPESLRLPKLRESPFLPKVVMADFHIEKFIDQGVPR